MTDRLILWLKDRPDATLTDRFDLYQYAQGVYGLDLSEDTLEEMIVLAETAMECIDSASWTDASKQSAWMSEFIDRLLERKALSRQESTRLNGLLGDLVALLQDWEYDSANELTRSRQERALKGWARRIINA